jgi:hypothetical protein
VLHMISNVGTGGRFGLTAIGNTAEDAEALYTRAQQIFDEEAREALK